MLRLAFFGPSNPPLSATSPFDQELRDTAARARRERSFEQVEAMPWSQSNAAVAAQLGRGRRVHLAIVETLERAPS